MTLRTGQIPEFGPIARERFEDASALLEKGRRTGAIYLVGHAVECTLKAILLGVVPDGQVKATYGKFREKGHSVIWLQNQLIRQKVEIPPAIGFSLTNFTAELLDYRYSHVRIDDAQAVTMMELARAVLEWGDEMAVRIINFKSVVRQIAEGLAPRYLGEHPEAKVDAYATSDGVRLRIVDPAFEGQGLQERQAIVLPYLLDSPKDVMDGIRVSLLITPAEREMSMLSLEFDDPSRSLL